jgi:hypothetical protein
MADRKEADRENLQPSTADAGGLWGSLWRGSVCVVSTVGVLCTYAEWGWNGLAMSAFTVAVFAGAIGASVWAGYGRASAARVVRLIVAGGWGLTAVTGLLAVFHVVGGCVALVLAASMPGLTSSFRRSVGSTKKRAAEPSKPRARPTTVPDEAVAGRTMLVLPHEVGALDDEALCLAWRRSFLLLDMARTTMERLAVVEQRTRLLDELHRRSPEGLAAWWVSGGRASGNPLPYLGERPSETDPGSAA